MPGGWEATPTSISIFDLYGIKTVQVKKGEINYSEIWLSQASLGYF